MSVMDFLFGGQAPVATTTYGASTASMPAWMSDYSQALMGKANQIAAQPAPLYTGPRVAATTQDQNNAYDITRDNVGAYKPYTDAGAGLMQTGANALSPDNIQQYMNPYTQNVIDRASLEATRHYNEDIMPQLSAAFTANGQYGSTRMAEVANNSARDVTEGLHSQSLAALSDAYKSATSTAGQSGQLQLTGGQNLVNTGSAVQGMGLRDAASLETIGKEQQNQNQSNLDTAYGDWQRQSQYPADQVNWLSTLLGNQAAVQPTSGNNTSTTTTTGGSGSGSGLADIANLLNAGKGIYDIFSAEGGLVRPKEYADGGSVLGQYNAFTRTDSMSPSVYGDDTIYTMGAPDDDSLRTDGKKYINSSEAVPSVMDDTIYTMGAPANNSIPRPSASAAPNSGPGNLDWFNHYGEGAEYDWMGQQAATPFNATGFANDKLYTPPASGAPSTPGTDYVGMAKDLKSAYDKYNDLFGDKSMALEPGTEGLIGMSYDGAGMLNAVGNPDLASGLGDISVNTPSLAVDAGAAGAANLGSLSSLIGMPFDAAGMMAATSGVDLASGLGEITMATPTLAVEGGTAAANAGGAAANTASSTGGGLSGTVATYAPYLALLTDAYDMIDQGSGGGKLEHLAPTNSGQSNIKIGDRDAISDLGLAIKMGTTGSAWGQTFGGGDDTQSPLYYQDGNGAWQQMDPNDMGALGNLGGGSSLPGMNMGKITLMDGDRFGLPGQKVGYNSMTGQILSADGKVYGTAGTADQVKKTYADVGLSVPLTQQYNQAGFRPNGASAGEETMYNTDYSNDPVMQAIKARMMDPNDPIYMPPSTDPVAQHGFVDMSSANQQGSYMDMYNKYGKNSGTDYLNWVSRVYDLINARTRAT